MADKTQHHESNGKIAVVMVRGHIRANPRIRKTLELLQLYNQNYCVVLDKTESKLGMVNKVKDYVAWGDISDDVLTKLREKRLETFVDGNGKKKEKKFFRLNPPRKGYGRKGIKKPFVKGGALGYRKDKINDLILRML